MSTLATVIGVILALAAFLGRAHIALAQADTSRTAPADTAGLAPVVAGRSDTATAEGYVMTRSPLTATLFSLAPGGGQIYNGQYIKAVLFMGAAGFFAVQAFRLHLQFEERVDAIEALPDDDSTGARLRLRTEREFYRDNRDNNIAYYLGVTLLSMIDAYVGAHLFDFDVDNSEDGLSSRVYLDPSRMGVGLMLRW